VAQKIRSAAARAMAVAGLQPLDVMLADMRFWRERELAEMAKPAAEQDEERLLKYKHETRTAAIAAAPYCHPRFAAVAIKTETVGEVDRLMQQIEGGTRQLGLFDDDIIPATSLPAPITIDVKAEDADEG
jgi:hypothetical protein